MAEPKTVKRADTDAAERPRGTRPVVAGTQGVISSGHALTSMAGMRMLLSGGNAFDALAASVLAAAVVEPIASYSLGAEGVFMLYDSRSGDLKSLSGQGTAPARATVDFYRSRGLDSIPTGPGMAAPLAFTVPGVAHAAISMLDRYGTKSFAEAATPAIEYAERGFPHYQYMIDALGAESTRQQFDLFPPGGSEIFYDDGGLPQEGSLLIQPGLANTLKAMASAEAASQGTRSDGLRAASDEFYRGGVARRIAKCSSEVGGVLDYEDLAGYESQFEEPLSTTFTGYEISCQRTWSQAAVLLQALNMLERFDLKAMGHNTPAYIHTVAEALKLAMADRQALYADPDHADVPVDGLLSKEYAAERATLIDGARAAPAMPEAGDPWDHSSMKAPASPVAAPTAPAGDRAREARVAPRTFPSSTGTGTWLAPRRAGARSASQCSSPSWDSPSVRVSRCSTLPMAIPTSWRQASVRAPRWSTTSRPGTGCR